MQDQGKRLLLAVALALGVMMVWQVLFPQEAPKKKPAGQGSAEVQPTVAGSPVGQALPPPGAGSASAAGSVGSGAVPADAPQLRVLTDPPRLQLGEHGTTVLLGANVTAVDQVAAVELGPIDARWTIVSGESRIPWPEGMLCENDASAVGYGCRPDAGGKPATGQRVKGTPAKVAIEGYGVKLALVAAFAVARVPEAARGPNGKPDMFIVAHPDGKQIQNLTVIPALAEVPVPIVGSGAGSGAGSGSVGPVAAPTPAPVPAVECTGPEATFAFDNVSIKTSACGGAVTSWKLLASKYDRERRKGEMIPAQGRGALLVNFAASTYVIPPEALWKAGSTTDTSIVYTWESPELLVEKTFTFLPADFLIKTRVVVTAKTGTAKQTLAVTSYGFQDPNESTSHARGNIEWKAACFRGEVRVASYKGLLERPRMENGVKWAGFAEGYVSGSRFTAATGGQFLAATAPTPTGGGDMVACNAYPVVGTAGLMQVDLIFPPADLKVGDPPVIREMATYIGPTSYELLEAADPKVGFSTGFKDVPDFGWFGMIGRPLLWLLHKLFDLVGNWGLAIVLLTVIVKASTLYFTTRSMRSMKAMAALTPRMKELQEKHKDDRTKLQQETMAMYKQYGVNPLAGCLPILLQMPIWIALYRMLSSAGELYLEPLIPGWISDLTSPDPYHILPVVLIATMFAQAKLQPQTATGMQQKILMYGLPLMFGIASFFFPSGLSLYIVTNTVLSALHSIYMNKYDKKGQAMLASLTKASGGGKPGGGKSEGNKPDGGKAEGSKKADRAAAAAAAAIEVEDRSPAEAADEAAAADVLASDGPDDSSEPDEPTADAEAGPGTSGPRPRGPSRPRRKRRGRN